MTYLVFQSAGTEISQWKLELPDDAVMVDLEIDQGIWGGGRRGRHSCCWQAGCCDVMEMSVMAREEGEAMVGFE